MKRFLLPGVLLACGAVTALAGPCMPGSLQDYISLGAGGCTLGAATFTSFVTVPGQAAATAISPGLVQITPGGSFGVPTFLLTLNSTAIDGDLFESIFRFRAASGMLTGASIALNSPTASDNGAVTGILDVCAGGNFSGNQPAGCSGTSDTAVVFAIEGDGMLQDSRTFAAKSFFDVFVDLAVDGGGFGSATLPSASVSVTAVPEPGIGLLVLAGLGFIGALRARRAL